MEPVPLPTRHSVGQAIRELRGDAGISQEELAHRSGLDRSYMGGVERAERNPSLRILLQVAAGLDLPLSRILARAEELASHPADGESEG